MEMIKGFLLLNLSLLPERVAFSIPSGGALSNNNEKFVPINIATMNILTPKCKRIFLDFLTNALNYLQGFSPLALI